MRDFTLEKYEQLLTTLRQAGYRFMALEDYVAEAPKGKVCILRHDVDARPECAVSMAMKEKEMGIRASYYFRAELPSNSPTAIKQVVEAGHELGYHYEDYVLTDGIHEDAWEHFQRKLEYFRQFYPVKTICAHGSPRSNLDNRALWDYYDYRQLGIICEPYTDLDYRKVFYLTDTGRRWDGYKMSIRDKIPHAHEQWKASGLTFHSSDDIIRGAEEGRLPEQILLSTHPQRWVGNTKEWLWEYGSQEVKNRVKQILMKVRRE
ncbi:MAG: hypothetical protein II692_02910 [Paludibacteraceae bacterium]|nr:hypothetical protein [Paludibacteraceae bacterium]